MVENESLHTGYLTGIDGIRAIAILALIIYHTEFFSFLPGGFTGIDIFFVISGYVLCRSLSGKSSLRLSDFLSEFYRGRLVRIFPALIVCLMFTMTASTLFIPSGWLSSTNSETGLAAFLGFSNWILVKNTTWYFSPRVEFNPFVHTWSLVIGEQFYLIFPLLFYIGLKFSKKRSVYGFLSQNLLLGLSILSFIYAFFETRTNHDQAFYLLPGRFWELSAGALFFRLCSNHWRISNSKIMSSVFCALGVFMISIGFVYSDQNSFPFPWALLPVFGTLLLIGSIADTSNHLSMIQKISQASWITYIGKISFSLYLWYWPVSVLFRWTLGLDKAEYKIFYLILVFSLAAASYHFIELPIRASKYLLRHENWKIIVYGLAMVCASYFAASYIDQLQATISLSVTKDRYTWYPQWYVLDEPNVVGADTDLAGRKLFVVGDSHAAAYRTMLADTASQLGIDVHIYEHGGCPVASLILPTSQTMLCKEYYDNTLADIENLGRPGDIVFLPSLRMPELADQFEVIDEETVIARFNSQRFATYREKALDDANRLIERFNTLGIHVLFEAPLPVFRAPPYRCSDWFNRTNAICLPGFSVERKLLLEFRQPVMDSLEILESQHRDLFIWDPFFVLCKDEICSAYDGDKPLFFDGDHLSAHGNRVLEPSFVNKILEIWRQ